MSGNTTTPVTTEGAPLIDCLINGVVQRVTAQFCSLHGTPVPVSQWEPRRTGPAATRKTVKSKSAKRKPSQPRPTRTGAMRKTGKSKSAKPR
jgi:hypothetical protein